MPSYLSLDFKLNALHISEKKIKNNETKQISGYMALLIDDSWECDYHISSVTITSVM
jgi:hypothetical protein